MASQGLLTESSLESLGHWEKGSKMPRHYDSAACVTELHTRKTVSDVLRSGWRPATDGNLPGPATPAGERIACPGTPAQSVPIPVAKILQAELDDRAMTATPTAALVVVDTRRNKAHKVTPPSIVSSCGCELAAQWTSLHGMQHSDESAKQKCAQNISVVKPLRRHCACLPHHWWLAEIC